MSWAAVVVAAGRGERFGRPKQLVEIAGKPMLAWSLQTLAGMREISAIVVTTEAEFLEGVREVVASSAPHVPAAVIAGGAERQDSVRLGLEHLARTSAQELVLVHDGARPMVEAGDVRRGMAVVAPGVGALLAVPVVDTIKRAEPDGRVRETLDRAQLWAAQTPQFGTLHDLLRVHRDAHRQGLRATDDATLLEVAGLEVIVVKGNPENFKVTVPADLARAELILRERTAV